MQIFLVYLSQWVWLLSSSFFVIIIIINSVFIIMSSLLFFCCCCFDCSCYCLHYCYIHLYHHYRCAGVATIIFIIMIAVQVLLQSSLSSLSLCRCCYNHLYHHYHCRCCYNHLYHHYRYAGVATIIFIIIIAMQVLLQSSLSSLSLYRCQVSALYDSCESDCSVPSFGKRWRSSTRQGQGSSSTDCQLTPAWSGSRSP